MKTICSHAKSSNSAPSASSFFSNSSSHACSSSKASRLLLAPLQIWAPPRAPLLMRRRNWAWRVLAARVNPPAFSVGHNQPPSLSQDWVQAHLSTRMPQLLHPQRPFQTCSLLCRACSNTSLSQAVRVRPFNRLFKYPFKSNSPKPLPWLYNRFSH